MKIDGGGEGGVMWIGLNWIGYHQAEREARGGGVEHGRSWICGESLGRGEERRGEERRGEERRGEERRGEERRGELKLMRLDVPSFQVAPSLTC